MDRFLAEKLWIVPWSVLALAALIVMAIYLFVDTSNGATGLVWFVQRWFHSLCWLLLALAAAAMAKITPLPSDWAGPLAVAGGLAYALFVATSLLGGNAGA